MLSKGEQPKEERGPDLEEQIRIEGENRTEKHGVIGVVSEAVVLVPDQPRPEREREERRERGTESRRKAPRRARGRKPTHPKQPTSVSG